MSNIVKMQDHTEASEPSSTTKVILYTPSIPFMFHWCGPAQIQYPSSTRQRPWSGGASGGGRRRCRNTSGRSSTSGSAAQVWRLGTDGISWCSMLGTSQRTVGPAVTQRLWTISGTTRATAVGNQSCHPGESYYVSGKRSGGAHGKATWFFWRASAPRRLHICCCGGFQSGVAGSSSRPAGSSATSTAKLGALVEAVPSEMREFQFGDVIML
jgi:hypothetical protein